MWAHSFSELTDRSALNLFAVWNEIHHALKKWTILEPILLGCNEIIFHQVLFWTVPHDSTDSSNLRRSFQFQNQAAHNLLRCLSWTIVTVFLYVTLQPSQVMNQNLRQQLIHRGFVEAVKSSLQQICCLMQATNGRKFVCNNSTGFKYVRQWRAKRVLAF